MNRVSTVKLILVVNKMVQHSKLIIKPLGLVPYDETWRAMRAFTDARDEHTADEIWLVEHPPVFTQGQAGKPEHVLNPHGIPVVQSDRGGQITYHGPGQLVAYVLIDLRRRNLSVRDFVAMLEQAVIDVLAEYHIQAHGDRSAPGVYVEGAKICSIGLRVRRGCSYHGIAFNVDMDLTPFSYINPCGLVGMKMTQTKDLGLPLTLASAGEKFIYHLAAKLDI
jgi:lipoyl(octanoyl) transferase